jgi:hypothetical protein
MVGGADARRIDAMLFEKCLVGGHSPRREREEPQRPSGAEVAPEALRPRAQLPLERRHVEAAERGDPIAAGREIERRQ